jgi:xylan 1,4-beta-xylosidase
MRRSLFLLLLLSSLMMAQAPQSPAKRYSNPLPLPNYPLHVNADGKGIDFQTTADPTVIQFKGKWYLFPSNGMAWVSPDLVNWEYHQVTLPGVNGVFWAPTVWEYQGWLYLTGNNAGLYRAKEPFGPWELIGPFRDASGKPFEFFDPMVFVDDDQRVYAYYAGGAGKGIYGVELDGADLTRFKGEPLHFFKYEPSHVWERYGDRNEVTTVSWMEGPWMTKHGGRYYLQYSAPGTEWKTYAVGLYTAGKPLGPFVYDARSPILHDRHGLINGTAHHSVVAGPGGTWWVFYTILYRNHHRFERRIAMDPVGWDEQGRMVMAGPSETPQWAPGVKARPWTGNDAGSIPLTIDKFEFAASSAAPGRDASYAIDNNVRTWWQAAAGDKQPWLQVDLLQEFTIDASRILFSDDLLDAAKGVVPAPYQYRVEASVDGRTWATVVDKTANTVERNIEYDEIAPVKGRYVRLVVTGAAKGLPVGVIEFTVFGK